MEIGAFCTDDFCHLTISFLNGSMTVEVNDLWHNGSILVSIGSLIIDFRKNGKVFEKKQSECLDYLMYSLIAMIRSKLDDSFF